MVLGCAVEGALAGAILGYGAAVGLTARGGRLPRGWEHPVGAAGLGLLAVGCGLGLLGAPPERFPSALGRILYLLPAAWLAPMWLFAAAASGIASLATRRRGWDAAVEATAEVGAVHTVLASLLCGLFSRAAWGVWWFFWDPHPATTAMLAVSLVGLLLVRRIVREPAQRATWSAVVAILTGVNLPVFFAQVERMTWSLHAGPGFVAWGLEAVGEMRWVLSFVVAGFLYLTVWALAVRWRIANARRAQDPREQG